RNDGRLPAATDAQIADADDRPGEAPPPRSVRGVPMAAPRSRRAIGRAQQGDHGYAWCPSSGGPEVRLKPDATFFKAVPINVPDGRAGRPSRQPAAAARR